jgi:alanyl-tRNA synthetase
LAAGVRRIEAVTGLNALAYLRSVEATLRTAARPLKASPADLGSRIEKLVAREKELEREIAELYRKLASGGGGGGASLDEMLRGAREIPGGRALAIRLAVGDAATLRETAEKLRDRLQPAVVLVGTGLKEKALLVLTVSGELTARYRAGDLIRPIAGIVGGSGGGRVDMAQAGGTEVGKLDEALSSLYAQLA